MKIKDKVLEQYRQALESGACIVSVECSDDEGEVVLLDGPGIGAKVVFLKQVDIESQCKEGAEFRIFPDYKWTRAKSQKDLILSMVRNRS